MDGQPLTDRFGVVLRPRRPRALDTLDPREVRDLLRERGAVLFRGFATDPADFTRFSDRFGSAYLAHFSPEMDRAPVPVDGIPGALVQTVNLGADGINPHSEASYSPMCPDFLWFYCDTPSRAGGRTLVCDGVEVLAALTEATRAEYETLELRFAVVCPTGYVEALLGAPFAELAARWLDGNARVDYRLEDGGETLDFRYAVPAVPTTRLGGVPTFTNSILSAMAYRAPDLDRIRAYAPSLSVAALDEAMQVAHARAHALAWEPRDVLVLDNSRIMHGREPFEDPARTIYVRMAREGD